jgi:hypothetical protein
MELPPLHGLRLARLYADYAQALLQERNGKIEPITPRSDIPMQVRAELETMVSRVSEAWSNRGMNGNNVTGPCGPYDVPTILSQ